MAADASAGAGAVYRGFGRGWTLAYALTERGAPLNAVWAASPTDVWAVGDRGAVLHFDGTDWTRVDVPSVMSLTAIAGTSGSDVVVGGAGGTLVTWDGKAWTVDKSVGTATVAGLLNVGGTLVGVTEKGELLKRGAAGWEKSTLTSPGAQTVAVRSLAVDAEGKLLIAGRVMLQGETQGQAALFHGAWGGSFDMTLGPVGGLFRGVASSAAGLLVTCDDKQVYTMGTPGGEHGGHDEHAEAEHEGGEHAEGQVLVGTKGLPSKPWFHQILWLMATLSAGLTAFYMFRLYFITFEGETRADPEVWAHCHENPLNMTVPLMLLAVLSVVGGWWGSDLHDWFAPVLRSAAERLHVDHHHTLMAYVPTLVGLTGIAIAFMMYGRPSGVAARLAEQYPRLYKVLYNKFYVDELYHLAVVRPFRVVGRIAHEAIDRIAIDGALVHGSASIWRVLGRALRPLQSGNVQQYAVAVAIGLAVLIWLVGMKPTLW